ncbi:MAG: hypothetical protein HYV76_01385 [Candidatus Vogelbacteria bacterium]|nr:hypothetical protein [Candidatus Vogelbacteria bacterium]
MLFFTWLSITAFATVSVLVYKQACDLRAGVVLVDNSYSFGGAFDRKVDDLAFYLAVFTKEFFRRTLMLSLLVLRRIIAEARARVIKGEKRFAHFVESLHGRHSLRSPESVSHFLREIKDHADQLKAKAQTR